jgi:hypothetical protein
MGNDKWNLFDDDSAREIEGPRFGESTYMLFLERQ